MFGGLTARRSGMQVHRFRTGKSAALLAHLAYHLNHDLTRDTLADTLWPDADYERARHSLAQALLSLRRQLEPPDLQRHSVIVADHRRIRILSTAVITDVSRFCSAADLALASNDPDNIKANCIAALKEFNGELLPGYFDDWLLNERDRLNLLLARVTHRLVQLLRNEGKPEEALEYLLSAVNTNQDSEALCYEMLSLQLELGRIRDAKIRFREYSGLLRELGYAPGKRIVELMAPLGGTKVIEPERNSVQRSRRISVQPAQAGVKRMPLFPATLNQCFGRDGEIAALESMLAPVSVEQEPRNAAKNSRLVTIVGLGGTGKTRLALEALAVVKQRYSERICYVTAYEGSQESDILSAMMAQIADRMPSVISFDDIAAIVGGNDWLFVIDNAETALDTVTAVAGQLLSRCTAMRMLVTSRLPLRIDGEAVVNLKPLPLPERTASVAELYQNPGVGMFVCRAQAVMPAFQLTERNADTLLAICKRLEGIPLAIELAAARIRTVSPAEMLHALENRLEFLVRTNRGRYQHGALADAIGWSFSLLAEELKLFFCNLMELSGPFTVAAAREICAEPAALARLEQLCDCCLMGAEPDPITTRFHILDSVKEFVRAQGIEIPTSVKRRHRSYFAVRSDAIHVGVRGKNCGDWLRVTDAEYPDYMRAVNAASGTPDALRICSNLWRYWELRGLAREGEQLLRQEIARADAECAWLPGALHGLGVLSLQQGNTEAGIHSLESCVALLLDTNRVSSLARALNSLALAHDKIGNMREADSHCARGIEFARQTGDVNDLAACLTTRARILHRLNQVDAARDCLTEALAIYEGIGDNETAAAVLNNLGCLALDTGEYYHARLAFDRALIHFRVMDRPIWLAHGLHNRGDASCHLNELKSGLADLRQAIKLRVALEDNSGIADTLEAIALAYSKLGRHADSVRLLAGSGRLRTALGIPAVGRDLSIRQAIEASGTGALSPLDYRTAWDVGEEISLDELVHIATLDISAS